MWDQACPHTAGTLSAQAELPVSSHTFISHLGQAASREAPTGPLPLSGLAGRPPMLQFTVHPCPWLFWIPSKDSVYAGSGARGTYNVTWPPLSQAASGQFLCLHAGCQVPTRAFVPKAARGVALRHQAAKHRHWALGNTT